MSKTIHYTVSGKGKVIVLLHGFIEEGSMWNDLAGELSKKYKVIVPDLPGFGNTPLTTSKLSMEYYANKVFTVLKEEKVSKCIILGHSMGGYVVLRFAEKYPEMLRGFGLLNSHCFEDTAEKKENRKKGNQFIEKLGTSVFVRELYSGLFHSSFHSKKILKYGTGQKLIDELCAKAEKYSPTALIAANTAMLNRKDKSNILKKAEVPVLLISGKQDESAPLEYSLNQASFAPVTHFHLFDNCKHMSVFEKQKETREAILNFAEFCF
jgi:pimeloyl-ACP methyl ester carboxylesterase